MRPDRGDAGRHAGRPLRNPIYGDCISPRKGYAKAHRDAPRSGAMRADTQVSPYGIRFTGIVKLPGYVTGGVVVRFNLMPRDWEVGGRCIVPRRDLARLLNVGAHRDAPLQVAMNGDWSVSAALSNTSGPTDRSLPVACRGTARRVPTGIRVTGRVRSKPHRKTPPGPHRPGRRSDSAAAWRCAPGIPAAPTARAGRRPIPVPSRT